MFVIANPAQVGSGKSLATGGPGALIIAWVIMGIMLINVSAKSVASLSNLEVVAHVSCVAWR